MKFIVYLDRADEWRWQLRAKNGRIIADSAEGYKRYRSMQKMMDAIIKMTSAQVEYR